MSQNDRRAFLQLLGAGAMASALPASIARALAIPANDRTGTIQDVEHIVILMQENRSFDHYFGTLSGVRGFHDPRAVTLPSGLSVFHQTAGDSYVLPFHPDAPDLGLQFLQDLPHDWASTHAAWNGGNHDQWVPSKGTTTMAHLTRHDIPFHYALADAFTICDAYHCSLLGPTDPNRYHMWTGWVGNDGSGGGPVIDNAEEGYSWSTFPERLEKAGISWKIYQDVGLGLTAKEYWGYTSDAYIGNYGDSSLLYFHAYQHAQPGTPLADKAKTGTDIIGGGTLFDIIRADVAAGTLPQVSWIVAPEAFTEHPNWPANYGAWYISQMLDALTSNPAVWAKTVVFLTYDENDGFFDHMVPPTPPASRAEGISTVDTKNEIFPGNAEYEAGPYGLGARVPMIVISPWSKGGYVNSQVFDHTSLIRFVEARFGADNALVREPNITKWRRAVTGDLTSAFNFARPNARPVSLPTTKGYVPPDDQRHPDYVPTVPAHQTLPRQESGVRPARPLPYAPVVTGAPDLAAGTFAMTLRNAGLATTVFQVRSGNPALGPWTYTVSPHHTVSDTYAIGGAGTQYDLSAYGPNGFLRAYRGEIGGRADLAIRTAEDASGPGITLKILNRGSADAAISIVDAYTGDVVTAIVEPGKRFDKTFDLAVLHGWYDFTVTVASDAHYRQHLAGHIETGRNSFTDPAIG